MSSAICPLKEKRGRERSCTSNACRGRKQACKSTKALACRGNGWRAGSAMRRRRSAFRGWPRPLRRRRRRADETFAPRIGADRAAGSTPATAAIEPSRPSSPSTANDIDPEFGKAKISKRGSTENPTDLRPGAGPGARACEEHAGLTHLQGRSAASAMTCVAENPGAHLATDTASAPQF